MIIRKGVTLVEVMLAVLIMAFSIIGISNHLGDTTVKTLEETGEADAMQFACDKMDNLLMNRPFDDVKTEIEEYFYNGKKTEILFTIQVSPVSISTMQNFRFPLIRYHPPCGEGNASTRGVEASTAAELDSQITVENTLSFLQLDEEKLNGVSGTVSELKDIKLTVRWRTKGTPDSAYDRHPIILYSRKARL